MFEFKCSKNKSKILSEVELPMCKGYTDLNNKYIDEIGVIHIFIINTKGQSFEVLYSGNHVNEVIKASWHIRLNKNSKVECVQSNNYNGKPTYLHRVDFENIPSYMVIDHIDNNPLNNRIENLRITDDEGNSKNKNTNNKYGLTGLKEHGKGWYNQFKHETHIVNTKTKHNLNEVRIDNLIAQQYLGYKHNEELFYLLNDLSEERIKEVADLLDEKIKNNKNKILKPKEYNHDIEEKDGYYVLHWNDKQMLFDCSLEFIKNMYIRESNKYWKCEFVENNKRIINRFHKELLGLRPKKYQEYNIHVDHLNNNPNDNRYCNLFITTHYSNMCNKQGVGYIKCKSGSYVVQYMRDYRFWSLIGGLKLPTFKTEKEAMVEVNRRRAIIESVRVKLKDKQELDKLIKYCLDNNYILENGLADLDLGYLYFRNILNKEVEI